MKSSGFWTGILLTLLVVVLFVFMILYTPATTQGKVGSFILAMVLLGIYSALCFDCGALEGKESMTPKLVTLPIPPIRSNITNIVDELIGDFLDRKGLKQEWSRFDEDVKDEIKNSWIKIIEKGVAKDVQQPLSGN